MIAVSLPWSRQKWNTVSFHSTLYLRPVLDLLLTHIDPSWQAEIRLGLQEALVNAAKHGNKLDPNKTVVVEFSTSPTEYSWIITDEGLGFVPQQCSYQEPEELLPADESENGRGLCIIYEIFDSVRWDRNGNKLTLYKKINAHNLEHRLVH